MSMKSAFSLILKFKEIASCKELIAASNYLFLLRIMACKMEASSFRGSISKTDVMAAAA